MLIAKSFTLTTAGGERFLTLQPELKQADFEGVLHPTGRFLIYEDVVPFDKMTDSEIEKHLERTRQEEYDPREDEIYLGSYSVDYTNGTSWQWEGKDPGFTAEEFRVIAAAILRDDQDDFEEHDFDFLGELEKGEEITTIPFQGEPLPGPSDEFTIFLTVNEKLEAFEVLNWGAKYEVQLNKSYYLLWMDEQGNWVVDPVRFEPLPEALKAEIIRQITEHYE